MPRGPAVTAPAPARIHVIVAREARTAVVFRRGPSRQVCTLQWDLVTDQLTLGQWFKGRIYAMRSDLSPDGRNLLYFALDGRYHSDASGTWTAVSRAPWLTALHLYPKGDSWNGGGAWETNERFWLNGQHSRPKRHPNADTQRTRCAPPGYSRYFGETMGVYLPRIRRAGWIYVSSEWGAHRLQRRVGDRVVEKQLFGGPKGRYGQSYWETHFILGSGEPEPLEDEWAEVDTGGLVFAREGMLWRRPDLGDPASTRLVRDLNPMRFEPRKAPYEGLNRRRRVNSGGGR